MTKLHRIVLLSALFLVGTHANSFDIKQGHFLLELGGFWSAQGQTQNIYSPNLIGDRYSVTDSNDSNALFGLGYLINGYETEQFGIGYGVNVFYLPDTAVSGTIDQEFIFTNLGYSYSVRHLPVYASAKAHINTLFDNIAVTIDGGIGPNIMQTNQYQETSLDGMTVPSNQFSGRSSVKFSAMAGIGLKRSNVINQMGLECGYRFFYLGVGEFNKSTNELMNTLNTGNSYAQGLVCTVTV